MAATAVQVIDTTQCDEITVLVIDDHRSFAELLSGALNAVSGIRCVGVAHTAAAGVARAVELRPAVVVVDIQMPDQDGLWATRRIREVSPVSVVAVVTGHTDPEWIARAAQAGACGFIPKDGSLAEMIEVVSHVRPGQMLVSPSTFDIRPPRQCPNPGPGVPPLSVRELQVLTYLGKGLQVDGIAQILGVSVHTCRGYMKSLHNKLGVRTQLEAVIKAQTLGIIGVPGSI